MKNRNDMKNQPSLSSLPFVKIPIHRRSRPVRRISFARLRQILAASDFDLGASFVIRHSSFVIVLALICPACTVTSYTSPSGERFTRSSLGANTSLHSLAFEATTNGLRRVELHGYQEDNAQALGAVTEAAIRTAIQSAK